MTLKDRHTPAGAEANDPATRAAIGEVLAQVAHEINNPLAGIQNAFLLVKDAVAPEHPHFRYVAAIEREIDRMSRTTRRLADSNRPEAVSAEEAVPAWVIADAMRRVEQAQRGKSLHFRIDAHEAPDLIPIDPDLLWQAIYQLGQDAADASFSGATVQVHAWAEAGVFWCSVRHPGPGRSHGHRLGALLTGRAVAALGGTMTTIETEGGGDEVRLRLPLAHSSPEAQ